MNKASAPGGIVTGLLFAIFLWGGNNAATKYLVGFWPPITVGTTRFLFAGFILLALLRWTPWLGTLTPLTPTLRRQLWWRGGLNLAFYIVTFNGALCFTSASHVALYLGASPVWALLWEQRPERSWKSAQRYGAATLALAGVVVLSWPNLRAGSQHHGWLGDLLALISSVLWTNYGRQCRHLSPHLGSSELTAHTFWRAAVLLLPLVAVEIHFAPWTWRTDLVLIQFYCVLASGVVAFALWNRALRIWPTSKVYLFNNLIPLSTMFWAHLCLGEPITGYFWAAMFLVVAGVFLGQSLWLKFLPLRRFTLE